MKDLTLKFADRADFSAFMESIGYYDDESGNAANLLI